MMPDDMLERKASDPGIIRNFSKVKTVLDNAVMIADTERREDKTFGEFIAGWPDDDIIGLWLFLKKHGADWREHGSLCLENLRCRYVSDDRRCGVLFARKRHC